MILIRYLDESYQIKGDIQVVAKSLSEDSLYVIIERVLVCVPNVLITSKIYPTGAIDELPNVLDWIAENHEEVDVVSWSLMDSLVPDTLH